MIVGPRCIVLTENLVVSSDGISELLRFGKLIRLPTLLLRWATRTLALTRVTNGTARIFRRMGQKVMRIFANIKSLPRFATDTTR